MSSLENRDIGLIKLAVKQHRISRSDGDACLARIADGADALALLAELGLDEAALEQLIEKQHANSIPAEFDGYRITGVIGKGGMSVVLKGEHLASGAEVALKVLSPAISELPTSRDRFHREIRSVARLVHPHIIRCYGSGETNNRPYLALEYMAKGDVANMLRKSRAPVPELQALRIALEVADGLQAIEAAEMMHRDIKPDNIFLAADGTVKIADLGLSKSADDDEGLTMIGKSVGTPGYMSPEQALGRYDVNIRTDLFSLGATLYHMLSGQLPFRGDSPQATMRLVVKEDPAPLGRLCPQLMPGTVAIVDGLMRKKPTDRYQRPAHLIEDLQRLARLGKAFDTTQLNLPTRQQTTAVAAVRGETSSVQRPASRAARAGVSDRFVVAQPLWRRLLGRLIPSLR